MGKLADLFFKEERTPREDDELRVLLDSVDSVAGFMAQAVGPTGDIQRLRAGNVVLDTQGIRLANKKVQLDRKGITLLPGTTQTDLDTITWQVLDDPGRFYGLLGCLVTGTTPNRASSVGLTAQNEASGSGAAQLTIEASAGTGSNPSIQLHSTNGININSTAADRDTTIQSDIVTDAFKIDAGNNVIQNGVAVEYEIETVTGTSDTLDHTNHMVLCDCSSNAITINLPAVSGVTGRVYHIKKIDSTANAVTVDGASSETIDDATTATISSQYESITIICDGSEWWII